MIFKQQFNGQTAIVTGAAIGIGFEIARKIVESGGNVVLNDVDADALNLAAQKIGRNTIPIAGDSSELVIIDAMIEAGVGHFGRIDHAIANAGITTFGKFLDYPIEDFQRLVAVNLQGTFFLAQKAAQQMIKQKNGGRIVLMSSVVGVQHHPDLAAYGMSKAAIRMLAQHLGVELGQHAITVNAIAPGATTTERTVSDPSYETVWSNLTPTNKPATVADIANTVLFLLSPQASQITGQTIVVDGGWTAYSPPPGE